MLKDEENKSFSSLQAKNGLLPFKKQIKEYNHVKNPLPISLGYLQDAYYFRILNKIDSILGDTSLYYEQVLRNDINRIVLQFINFMIDNSYYEDIRGSLIAWKYDLAFMNDFSEDDFLSRSDNESVTLDSKSYHTDDFPGHVYVDKCVLVLESINNLAFISNAHEDFRSDKDTYVSLIMGIVNVLVCLSICNEELLGLIEDDFNNILDSENDVTPSEVKELIHEMMKILEIIKSKLRWSVWRFV
ncbi:MAG: hypothetical protein K2J20_06640 [Bacilli bacterium]|nr:hypothetical protein [Bacilli bacterium]